ncbi:MAG: SH3 domain-containing protein [Clostridia bacterium]
MKFQTSKSFKKTFALFMAFVIAFFSLPNVFVDAQSSGDYCVTSDYVNLRTEASISASVINVLPPDTTLEILDSSNEKWYKVKVSSGQEGYVYAEGLIILDTSTPEPTATASPTTSPTETPEVDTNSYLQVIDAPSGLNLRESATTSSSILKVISNGSILINLGKSGSWYKVTDISSNITGYVYEDYVTEYDPSTQDDSDIQLSSTAITLSKYQSVYLSVGTSDTVNWSSSDTSIATVEDGIVYGKSVGTVMIKVQNVTGTAEASCKITVTEEEEVRYAFPEENSASANVASNLIAVTPVETEYVIFEVNGQTILTDTYTTESEDEAGYTNTVRLFSASVTLPQGEYTAKAYSTDSSDYYSFTVFVSKGTDVYTSTERQISSSMISILESFEGYAPTVYIDTLGGGIPTVGYGLVLYSNDVFYNNLTKTEARAQLVDTLTTGGYVSSINSLVSSNNLNMNQAQFDALVSFTYNVGSGWTSSSDTKTALLSIKDFSTLTETGNTDADAFITLMLQWHHASGECIPGLLYRRLAEAKIFVYSNYEQAYSSNANYKVNVYDFTYPSCVKSYE